MFDDTGGGDLDEVEDAFTSIGVLFGIGARDGMGGMDCCDHGRKM